jgi:arylsulfatase A-like enzyme
MLALLASLALAGATAGAARPPNVVLILADDLGYGDLGVYGQKRIRTPRLDRMAAEGLRFTEFYAGSTVCAPSRYSLMTGRHMGHAFIRGNSKDDLRPGDVTVAEVLHAAGYATGLAGKWGLGHEGSWGVPTRKGFDSFFGYLDQTHAHNSYPTFLLRGERRVPLRNVVPQEGPVGQGVATVRKDWSHDLFALEALRFVEQNRSRPFFLFLALTLPHANNEAGKDGMEVPELGDYAREGWPRQVKQHAAMVTRMDRDVGRVLDLLKRLGLDEDTLVVFTSDNGPHAEGGYDPELNDSNGPLRGIKRDLYEGGIRVPFIARWPGRVPAGRAASGPFAFWDLLPTFAELAGAGDRVVSGLDGRSFAATLLGRPERQAAHAPLYWAFYERGGARALREGRFKVVEQPMHSKPQLYDLEADLGEQQDLAGEHPELVERLRGLMNAADQSSERWRFPPAAAR